MSSKKKTAPATPQDGATTQTTTSPCAAKSTYPPCFDPDRAAVIAMSLIEKAGRPGSSPFVMAQAARTILDTVSLYWELHQKGGCR